MVTLAQPVSFREKDNVHKRLTISKKKLSREILIELLDECDWNKAEVDRRVGLSRTAIWKYIKKWDISLKPSSNYWDYLKKKHYAY